MGGFNGSGDLAQNKVVHHEIDDGLTPHAGLGAPPGKGAGGYSEAGSEGLDWQKKIDHPLRGFYSNSGNCCCGFGGISRSPRMNDGGSVGADAAKPAVGVLCWCE